MKKIYHFSNVVIPTIIILMIVLFSCKDEVTTPQIENTNISGTLVDEQDVPVPFAIIQVFNTGSGISGFIDKDTTDIDGNFTLNGVPQDFANMVMRIEHEDFQTLEIMVNDFIKGKDKNKLGIQLMHGDECSGVFEIMVSDENDKAISDVTVLLKREDRIIRKSITDSDGILKYDNVCPGYYWVQLMKAGYKVAEGGWEISAEDSLTIPFQMITTDNPNDSCCDGVINLTILDSLDKGPVESVKVRIFKDGDILRDLLTNDRGQITFENLCEGLYEISFIKDGFYGEEFDVIVTCNDTIDLTKLILRKEVSDSCCDGVVYIFLNDSLTNEGIPNVKAGLFQDGKKLDEARSSEGGLLIFDNMCEGRYEISLDHELYREIEFVLELGCNDTLELRKSMVKREQDSCCDGQIEIVVVDSKTKEPIDDAEIKLWQKGRLLKSTTTERGMALFTDICEGEYWIDIILEHYKAIEFAVEVPCNEKVIITRELKEVREDDSCCNGVIYFAPKDSETKELLKGAKVSLWFGDDLLLQEKVGDRPLIITDLCEGEYQFTVIADGYLPKEDDFKLECNDTLEISFFVESIEDTCCDGRVTIVPRDKETKELIKGAIVKIWKNGKLIEKRVAGNDGVVFEELCEGAYGVDIMSEHYTNIEFEFELDCNEDKTIEKELVASDDDCCDGKMKITAIDKESGDVLIGAIVKLHKNGELLKSLVIEEDFVLFEELCKGKYAITIEYEGYRTIEFHHELGCNEVKEFEKSMQKGDDCCDGKLKISAIDKESGDLLKGAKVKLLRNREIIKTKVIDRDYVTFEELCEGKYTIIIEYEGYKSIEFHYELGCNEEKEFEKKMEKSDDCCRGIIKVYPINKKTRKLINGAVVKIWFNDKLLESATVKNAHVIFDGLCEGKYGIDVIHEEYEDIEFIYELSCNEQKTFEKALEPMHDDDCCDGKIYVVVQDSSSNDKIKGVVSKLWKDGSKIGYETTGSDGVVDFEHVCESEHVITLEKTNYNSREIRIDVGCNDTLELHYKMLAKEGGDTCRTAEIELLVKDSDSKEHLAGATVWIYDLEGNLVYEGETDSEGYFNYSSLKAPGKYKFKAWIEGYDDNHKVVEWDECKKKEEILMLDKVD